MSHAGTAAVQQSSLSKARYESELQRGLLAGNAGEWVVYSPTRQIVYGKKTEQEAMDAFYLLPKPSEFYCVQVPSWAPYYGGGSIDDETGPDPLCERTSPSWVPRNIRSEFHTFVPDTKDMTSSYGPRKRPHNATSSIMPVQVHREWDETIKDYQSTMLLKAGDSIVLVATYAELEPPHSVMTTTSVEAAERQIAKWSFCDGLYENRPLSIYGYILYASQTVTAKTNSPRLTSKLNMHDFRPHKKLDTATAPIPAVATSSSSSTSSGTDKIAPKNTQLNVTAVSEPLPQ